MESVDTRGMRSVCFGISDLMMQIMLPAKDFAALDIRAIPRFPHVPSAPELDNYYLYRSVDIVLKPEAQKNDKEHVCSDPFDYWGWVSLNLILSACLKTSKNICGYIICYCITRIKLVKIYGRTWNIINRFI